MRQIVEESLSDGASIAEVPRHHDLNANQLFTWRRRFGVEQLEPHNCALPRDGKWADVAVLKPICEYKAQHAQKLLTFDAVFDALGKAQT